MKPSRRPARLAALAALLTVAVSGTACSSASYPVAGDQNAYAYHAARYAEKCVASAPPKGYALLPHGCREWAIVINALFTHLAEEVAAADRQGKFPLQRALVRSDLKAARAAEKRVTASIVERDTKPPKDPPKSEAHK